MPTNLPEAAVWHAAITQIDISEPVSGGVDGVANRALIQLGDRTKYLFDQVNGLTVGAVSATGTYANLRAQATTKEDVGLGLLQNLPKVDDPSLGTAAQYASGAAVKALADQIGQNNWIGKVRYGYFLPTTNPNLSRGTGVFNPPGDLIAGGRIEFVGGAMTLPLIIATDTTSWELWELNTAGAWVQAVATIQVPAPGSLVIVPSEYPTGGA